MSAISNLLSSTTNRLVAIICVCYFLASVLNPQGFSGFELYNFNHPSFAPWQLVSYLFLHGSVMHLLLNMIGLWSFGRVLERVWGGRRFLFFFLVCGVGAGVIALIVNQLNLDSTTSSLIEAGVSEAEIMRLLNNGQVGSNIAAAISRQEMQSLYNLANAPMVGASGAIYGVLIAFAMLFPNFKIMLVFLPIPIAAKYFVPVLLLIDLTAGFTGISIFGLNIAHFAHIGGALIGFLIVLYWMRQHPQS
ncbi:MAG: rhomboid family intramembrane serine protease [Pseudomonadota bacterium]